jgi:hypothetical protein
MAESYKDAGPHNPLRVYSNTDVDLAEVAAAACAEQDITITGLETTDVLLGASCNAHTANLVYGNARIKAADTLAVQIANPTAGALTPAANATWTVAVVKGA